jgi:cell division septum initiation protein DivIVA
MDILHLIDRLEELFNESRTVPFTRSVVVDEDRMLDIIDQMRVTIPEEFKKAQQLAAQKDRILAQAQEEANRIVQLAREKAEQMVEREAVLRSAQNRADQILSQARADAQATRQDADDYVIDSLRHLEGEMSRLQTQVRNGLRKLEEERLRAPRPLPGIHQEESQGEQEEPGGEEEIPEIKDIE